MQKVFHAVRNRWFLFVEKLEALPLKKFIATKYEEWGCYCALGSFVREYAEVIDGGVSELEIEVANLDMILERPEESTLIEWERRCRDKVLDTLKERTGLGLGDLIRVQSWNDTFGGPPEARYERVLEMAREEAVHAHGETTK